MSQIYDQFKSIIEKDSQTEKKRRDLYQTHFISSYRRSQKNGFQRGSERTICSTKWNAYSILDTCPNTVGVFLFLTPYWVAK